MVNDATIKIKRTGKFTASVQPLIVILDGQKIGKISNDETASFTVDQGQHSIFVKGTFGVKTQKIDFHISSGEPRNFKCGIPLNYNLVLVVLSIWIASNIRHHDYLVMGISLACVLFVIYSFLVPGSCFYLKEAYDLQREAQ